MGTRENEGWETEEEGEGSVFCLGGVERSDLFTSEVTHTLTHT